MPAPGADVAVEFGNVAHERKRHGEGVGRDLGNPIVRGIGHPNPASTGILDIDGVEARAEAARDADLGACVEDPCVHRRVLHEQPLASSGSGDDFFLRAALPRENLDARIAKQGELEVQVGKIMIGDEDLQWLSRGTSAPLFPTRKSRSAPSLAWFTCST